MVKAGKCDAGSKSHGRHAGHGWLWTGLGGSLRVGARRAGVALNDGFG